VDFADDADAPSPERARIGREVAARLEANPRVEHIPAGRATLYAARDFLSAATCAELVRLIDADLRPSEMVGPPEAGDDYRTSRSCNLPLANPAVHRVEQGIAALLGLPPSNAEALQGQRYAPGEQFREHVDYFRGDMDYWPEERDSGGQRTWTAMAYLNPVEGGGETRFVQAGIAVRPVPGLLLIWNNLLPDGSPNTGTMHEGCAVQAGAKYVVTKWFRERRRLDL
jgi:prolyl 4-hydroxylase